jgi:hypothetical protein
MSRQGDDDAAIARELARDDADTNAPITLDEALGRLAEACWMRAGESLSAYEDEETARALVGEALDFAATRQSKYREARRIFRAFLRTKRPLLPRVFDPRAVRLQRTYWLMASRLFEIVLLDENRPPASPYLHLDSREPNFHEPNFEKAAEAIGRGLKQFRTQYPQLSIDLPTTGAIRKNLQRHVPREIKLQHHFHPPKPRQH